MCKKFFLLTSSILLLVLAGNAIADSIVPIDPASVTDGDVYLLDNVGIDVPDDSANNNTANLVGNPQVVDGLNGKALQFDGIDDGVHIPDAATVNLSTHQNHTAIAIFQCADATKSQKQVVYDEGGNTRGLTIYVYEGLAYVGGWNLSDYTPEWTGTFLSAPISSNKWHVVSAVLRGGGAGQEDDKFEMWMDGKLIGKGPGGELRSRSNDCGIGYHNSQVNFHDGNVTATGSYFEGIIDELWILNQALSEAELSSISVNRTKARNPVPKNEAIDILREATLAWESGQFVDTHDVFLGTNFNDVNNATNLDPMGPDQVYRARQGVANYAPPQRLELGTTYYWRIDEVNAPPTSNVVFKGNVWSFTTEPVGYPISGTNIIATASSMGQAEVGPEKTIDGSGLVDDLHSAEATDMWLSDSEPSGAWIQYEFDKVYELHEMWVWNSNQVFEPLFGFGFKEVTVEYSTNGTDWTALANVPEFAQAPGTPDYAHDTTVNFDGGAAKYVKLTATSNWGGILPQFGLSEVRFFSIPVSAREPSPDIGATDVGPEVTLSWRAGREAATHDVYMSTDQQAVIDGNVPPVNVTDASYSAALNLGSTYYWRIDEVNDTETPTIWQGDVWSFSTPEYLVVDGFEDYNDWPPYEIYTTWVDGYENPANGSQVGYFTVPSAETMIVHDANQAMPLFYSNTGGATYSEAERTFAAPQDWTQYDIKTLELFFFGTVGNTGQLYVKINGVKVPYDGDATNLALAGWQAWNIDLAAAGVNLQSVTTLAIGIDGNAAAGTLYVDDIRLYPYERQFVTPVQPDPAGLVTYWMFDEGSGTIAQDSSASGYVGTFIGAPQWVNGRSGTALDFDGTDDFVEYDLGADQTWTAHSVSVWAKADALALAQYKSVFSSHTPNTSGFQMDVDGTDPGSYRYYGVGTGTHFYGPLTTEWVHLATTCDGTTTILYYNGHLATTINGANLVFNRIGVGVNRNEDNFFQGIIDEFHLYDRALSDAEVAGLAGLTQPFDKPF